VTKSEAQALLRRASNWLAFALLIFAFLVAVLWERIVINIPAGHSGVMWRRFSGGTDVISPPVREGIHLIWPWDRIFDYDMRLAVKDAVYDVVSNEGVQLKMGVAIRYRPIPATLGQLHKNVGPNYLTKMLVPSVGSVGRERIARYKAEELYSSKRFVIRDEMYAAATNYHFGVGGRDDDGNTGNLVALQDILILEVWLPDRLREATEKKLEQEQIVGEYQFRVEREKLESARKAVEAEGIRKFQEIVTPGISDAYLRWQGIDATLKLSSSPNSKLVIMGNGPGGLPVILNGFDSSEKPAAPHESAPTTPTNGKPGPLPPVKPAPLVVPPVPLSPPSAGMTPQSTTPATGAP
jgi:regulator of protease activity HflC (stomatin/prohibitin superfamily)